MIRFSTDKQKTALIYFPHSCCFCAFVQNKYPKPIVDIPRWALNAPCQEDREKYKKFPVSSMKSAEWHFLAAFTLCAANVSKRPYPPATKSVTPYSVMCRSISSNNWGNNVSGATRCPMKKHVGTASPPHTCDISHMHYNIVLRFGIYPTR